MTRTLTRDEIRNLQAQLRDARSIDEVLKIARTRRIERIPGGYRIEPRAYVRRYLPSYHRDECDSDECAGECRTVEYTEADLAWFRRPLGGGQ